LKDLRRTTRDYVHFFNLALASATEVRYLIGLAGRLEYFDAPNVAQMESRYEHLIRSLQKMIVSLSAEA
jgi:four helix bundle protein